MRCQILYLLEIICLPILATLLGAHWYSVVLLKCVCSTVITLSIFFFNALIALHVSSLVKFKFLPIFKLVYGFFSILDM